MNNTEVLLYGPLKEKYGSNFIFEETNTVGDVIDALAANFTDFRVDVLKTKNYNVFIDDISIGMNELPLEHFNTKTIKIVPLIAGASGKEMSVGKIVLGVALIALSFAIPASAGMAIGMLSGALQAGVMKIGIGLLLSGFAELIFSPPEEDPDEEQSYLFNGAVNVTKQGLPVPIGYGRLKVGSTNISNELRNYSTKGVITSDFSYSNEYIKILDCICEGEIQGIVGGTDGVYLNDVPLTEGTKVNIEGIDVQFRIGENDQTYIEGFEAAARVRALSREVREGYKLDGTIVPGIQPTERIVGPNTTAIVLALLWTNGLYDFDQDNNKYKDWEVYFKIEYTTKSDKTWRHMGIYDWSSINHNYNVSPIANVGDMVAPTVKSGGVDEYNSVKLLISWNRILLSKVEGVGIDGGMDAPTVYNFAGKWIKVLIEYRDSVLAGAWSSKEVVYTGDLRVTGNFVSETQVNLETLILNSRRKWEFRITFLDADVATAVVTDPDNGYNPFYTTTKHATITCIPYEAYTETPGREIEAEGKVLTAFKKDYFFRLPVLVSTNKPDFPIDIRITRTSQDDVPHNDKDNDDDFASDFQWSGITELIEQKFVYPNTALVGMEFDAKTYDSLPQRSYDVKLLKINIPTNYDPIKRKTSGLWRGDFKIAWSDNPAWAFYDMVINDRYGMGQYLGVNNINKWMLYEIAKFCDEQLTDYAGHKEPRYSINTYIAKQDDALVFLRHFSSIFRGMVYWMDNKITATYDHPSNPVCVFSNSNVIDGTFTYTGSARDTRYNVVYVSWSDPSIDFKNAIEYVEDTANIAERGEIVTTDLTALGCTSRAQAFRSGRALLATERETVVFSCTLDNVGGKPGDLTEIYDKYRSNVRHSGRISRIEGDKVYLDDYPLDLDNKTYKLRLISSSPQTETLENGEVIKSLLPKIHIYNFEGNNYSKKNNSILVTGRNADGNKLSATTDIPKNTVWAIHDDKLTAQIFRIISIAEKGENVYEVNGLAYNINKQDWIDDPTANEIKPLPDTTQSDLLYLITMVNVVENRRAFSNSTTNIISIHWDKAPGIAIKKFIVEYRYNDYDAASGPWVEAGRVDDSSFLELEANMPKGWYTGRVSAVLHNGAVMVPVVSKPVYLTGKALPPHTVSNFRYAILEGGILRLLWDKSNDFDFSHYEIQNGISGCKWNDTRNTVYPNEKNTYLDILDNFEPDFLIKAIDTSGSESIHSRKLTVTFALSEIDNVNGRFIPYGYDLSWNINKGMYAVDYTEIKEGLIYSSSKFIMNDHNEVFSPTELDNWSDSAIPGDLHNYWLTPVDTRNNRGKTVKYETKIWNNYLENVNLIPEHLRVDMYFDRIDQRYNNDNTIHKPGNRFTVDYVEIETRHSLHGPILATNKIYGEYYSIREMAAATYTYKLTPYDIAGRRGNSWYSGLVPLDDGGIVTAMYQHMKFDGVLNRVYYDKDKQWLSGPLVTQPETWQEHFHGFNRRFTNIQDQISAGFPTYLMPEVNAPNNEAVYSETYIPASPIIKDVDVIISVQGFGNGELKIYVTPSGGTRMDLNSIPTGVIKVSETHFRVRIARGFTSIRVDYQFRSKGVGLYTITDALIIGEIV